MKTVERIKCEYCDQIFIHEEDAKEHENICRMLKAFDPDSIEKKWIVAIPSDSRIDGIGLAIKENPGYFEACLIEWSRLLKAAQAKEEVKT